MLNFRPILEGAHNAATRAQIGLPETAMCGFAWVTVDGNSPIARWCRTGVKLGKEGGSRRFYGDKGYPLGWQWWEPGGYHGQSITIHEAGAQAFREYLSQHGISATVGSRYD